MLFLKLLHLFHYIFENFRQKCDMQEVRSLKRLVYAQSRLLRRILCDPYHASPDARALLLQQPQVSRLGFLLPDLAHLMIFCHNPSNRHFSAFVFTVFCRNRLQPAAGCAILTGHYVFDSQGIRYLWKKNCSGATGTIPGNFC